MKHGANLIRLTNTTQLSDNVVYRTPYVESEDANLSRLARSKMVQKHKFQQAVIYGKAAMQDSARKNLYEGTSDQSAFDAAFADFLNAPSIDAIDLSEYSGRIGSRISITVVDDFEVASVYVKIQNADGSIADEGFADPGLFKTEWIFTASQDNPVLKGDKITVTASDLPGNDAALERYL